MGDLKNLKKDEGIQNQLVQLGIFNDDEYKKLVNRTPSKKYTYWTPEEDLFLRTHYQNWKGSGETFLKKFNRTFNTTRSLGSIQSRVSELGIRKCSRSTNTQWTPEEQRYLRRTYPSFVGSIEEYTEEFNKKFGTARTPRNIYYRAFSSKIKRNVDAVQTSRQLKNATVTKPIQETSELPPAVPNKDQVPVAFPIKEKRKNVFLRIYDAIFNS